MNPTDIIAAFLTLKRQEANRSNSEIVEEIAVEFNTDASQVRKIVVKFAISRANDPGRLYALDDVCNIKKNGREIKSCRELTGSPRENQRWLSVERRCLLCCFEKFRNGDNVDEVAKDLAAYFDRSPGAITQEYYRLTSHK